MMADGKMAIAGRERWKIWDHMSHANKLNMNSFEFNSFEVPFLHTYNYLDYLVGICSWPLPQMNNLAQHGAITVWFSLLVLMEFT
jgi:hypothetical protein